MRCAYCGEKLIIRSGPYGEFMCCPKSTKSEPHPTKPCVSKRATYTPAKTFNSHSSGGNYSPLAHNYEPGEFDDDDRPY